MIVSASRRTDIPAYYSEWFMSRVQAGWFLRINPFNAKQRRIISLKPEDVDVIVFWTKNPKPLMQYLHILTEKGYRYYFQYTLNDYPVWMEPGLPSIMQRIDTFKELSRYVGRERVVWRFDPVVLSTSTPVKYLTEKFAYLASELSGYTDRVVISFLDVYGKVKSRFNALKSKQGVVLYDITSPQFGSELKEVVESISHIALANGMQVFTCAESIDLSLYGIARGKCIDDELIQRLFGVSVSRKKDKAQRSGCLCVEAADMGMYNTCRAGCVYCYARTSERLVRKNTLRYNPTSPALVGDVYHTINVLERKNSEESID